MAGVTYPTTTIPVPADVQAHTNELFQFDDEYLVQTDIRQDDFVRIFDRNGQNVADKTEYLFQMNDIANNSWYSPSRSFIKIDYRVVLAQGDGDVVDSPQVPLSDLRGIFNRVRFGLGGQTVTDISDYFFVYPASDNAFWTPQYAHTIGTMMGCYPVRRTQPGNEQAKFLNETEEMTVNNDTLPPTQICTSWNNHQTSWGKREYLVDTSATARESGTILTTVCSVFIPLYHLSSVLQYFDKATTQLQWELQLFLHDNQNINIETDSDGVAALQQPKLELCGNGIELWARRITPTETARLVLTEKLNRGLDMSIKWADLQIYKNTIFTGNIEAPITPPTTNLPFDLRVTVTANRPVSAVVLFQYTDGPKGTLNSKEWAYDRFDTGFINRLQMLVNNVQIPTEGMNMINDYAEDNAVGISYPHIREQFQSDVARTYYEYLRYTGNYKAPYLTGFGGGAGTLSLEDWRNRCPAYCFDLSAREIGQWAGGSSEIRLRGNVVVPPVFGAPPDDLPSQRYKEVTAWVLLYTERTLGIHLQNWNSYVGVA